MLKFEAAILAAETKSTLSTRVFPQGLDALANMVRRDLSSRLLPLLLYSRRSGSQIIRSSSKSLSLQILQL